LCWCWIVLDRAGWHTSLRLRVPNHVYLHFLPSYSPELQPAEHLWPLTNAPLINRHFSSIEDLEEAQGASPTLRRTPSATSPRPLHYPLPLVATASPQTTRAEAEVV
jgi:DDE superfamily endonuclease